MDLPTTTASASEAHHPAGAAEGVEHMRTPHVYVVREIETQYAVYPLDSELMRFYPSEQDAVRHALFMLRWLGHSGDPKMQRVDGELRVSFEKCTSDPYRQFVM